MRTYLIILILSLASTSLLAQQPKLYLKVYGGIHGQKYIYRAEERSTEFYPGWQGGFGFRVSYRKVFGELDVDFVRSKITVDLADSIAGGTDFLELKLNSMNVPIKLGFIPIKTPFFKWYVYSGFSNRFNTRSVVILDDEKFKFKPSDISLRVYNLDFIVGTQADLGWLNVDFYYATGITNSYKSNIRTNYHQFLVNFGFIF